MRGNNSVADLLDTVEGILDEDRDFTDREPVMIIDPDGDLFAVEFAAQLFPAPGIELESQHVQPRSPRQAANFARDKLNNAIALRVNPVLERINIFGGAVVDSLRRLARAQRHAEDAIRRLSRKTHKENAELRMRIEKLEGEIADLKARSESEGTGADTAR